MLTAARLMGLSVPHGIRKAYWMNAADPYGYDSQYTTLCPFWFRLDIAELSWCRLDRSCAFSFKT
jgi:hypothetical protein